jgi:hypothetical protein
MYAMFSTLPNIILFWFFTIQPVSFPENTLSHLPENIKRLKLTENKQSPLQEVIKKAEFPDGRKALKDYIDTNLNIPAIAFERNGNKEVVFGAEIIIRIAEDGSVGLIKYHKLHIQPNDPEVVQAVKKELNKFIGQMPKWTPASKNGKQVASVDTISFIQSYAPDVTLEEYYKLKKGRHSDNPNNTNFSSSELKTKDGKQVFQFVQKQPAFPGGDKALRNYLTQHLPYLQKQNSGELVVMSLIINENGAAEDIIIIKPKGVTLDSEETRKVLDKMPLWTPGKQNNKPVPFSYIFPIKY